MESSQYNMGLGFNKIQVQFHKTYHMIINGTTLQILTNMAM